MIEYQRQKLLAEISGDREKILDRLAELETPPISPNQRLLRTQGGRVLNMVTERSFEEILRDLHPEQAKKLNNQRERERVRGG